MRIIVLAAGKGERLYPLTKNTPKPLLDLGDGTTILEKQLESIQKERTTQRKARRNELKVALVGYTNSGKTTVMNAMTKAHLQAEDILFATLDANVRTIDPTTRPKLLLSDTVGFIRKLPHSLIESFKSTLDEVLEADLLLHVVDVSHRNYRLQMETTEKVLQEIGAGNIPTIMIFNKTDQLDEPHLGKILKQAYDFSISISALNMEDIVRLRNHIFSYFEQNLRRVRLRVPPANNIAMSLIYRSCLIQSSDFDEPDFATFEVQATREVLARLENFIVEDLTESKGSFVEKVHLSTTGSRPKRFL